MDSGTDESSHVQAQICQKGSYAQKPELLEAPWLSSSQQCAGAQNMLSMKVRQPLAAVLEEHNVYISPRSIVRPNPCISLGNLSKDRQRDLNPHIPKQDHDPRRRKQRIQIPPLNTSLLAPTL